MYAKFFQNAGIARINSLGNTRNTFVGEIVNFGWCMITFENSQCMWTSPSKQSRQGLDPPPPSRQCLFFGKKWTGNPSLSDPNYYSTDGELLKLFLANHFLAGGIIFFFSFIQTSLLYSFQVYFTLDWKFAWREFFSIPTSLWSTVIYTELSFKSSFLCSNMFKQFAVNLWTIWMMLCFFLFGWRLLWRS